MKMKLNIHTDSQRWWNVPNVSSKWSWQ